MNSVTLLLGSNLDDSSKIIERAIVSIANFSKIEMVSASYKSEPWGFNSENWFINRGVVISTDLLPYELLSKLLSIEKEAGRVRDSKSESVYSSRVLDIDIIFYNNLILEEKDLTIPHKRMHLRSFVLKPLNELIPDYIHPIFKKSVNYLFRECKDKSKVIKL